MNPLGALEGRKDESCSSAHSAEQEARSETDREKGGVQGCEHWESRECAAARTHRCRVFKVVSRRPKVVYGRAPAAQCGVPQPLPREAILWVRAPFARDAKPGQNCCWVKGQRSGRAPSLRCVNEAPRRVVRLSTGYLHGALASRTRQRALREAQRRVRRPAHE